MRNKVWWLLNFWLKASGPGTQSLGWHNTNTVLGISSGTHQYWALKREQVIYNSDHLVNLGWNLSLHLQVWCRSSRSHKQRQLRAKKPSRWKKWSPSCQVGSVCAGQLFLISFILNRMGNSCQVPPLPRCFRPTYGNSLFNQWGVAE